MDIQKETDREYCLSILKEYTKTESLLKHAYAVSACVEEYAVYYNEEAAYWANIGLLHDFDYEKFPTQEEHPYKGAEILKSLAFEEEFIQTILSHTPYTGVPRTTLLRKVLFACDELAGFILAVVYVRPSKSIDDLEPRSVIKKLKDKAFARAVSREDIYNGAEGLGVPLEEHIAKCIHAMKKSELLWNSSN